MFTGKAASIPSEAMNNGINWWEQCILCWFIRDAPNFRIIITTAINKLEETSKVKVANGGKYFVFQFDDLKRMERVLFELYY